MADSTVWKNVAVNMQSVIGSALTISAITKANPAVASSTGHGLSDGDYVLLKTQGMRQVNQRVVRVDNKTVDTFELEGINSTDFDAFVSGTAEKITFGTSISSATTVSASGGEFDMIDTTTIHDSQKSEVPGLPSAISYEMDHKWDSADAGQIAMKAASDIQATRAFKFQFGTGGKILVFAGYVGFTGAPGGSAQALVTCRSVVTTLGTATYYAS